MSKSVGSSSWIEYLHDPELVARIQAAFGIKVHRKSSLAEKTESYDGASNQALSISSTSSIATQESYVSNRHPTTSQHMDSQSGSNRSVSGSSSGIDNSAVTVSHKPIQFTIENKFWYYLAKFGGAMGDEVFYASFFPFWFWNIDGAVCRRVVLIWGILMYIGQGLKDIIRWPRPASPPVVRIEKKWELEYGMPSTHAISASAVPFAVLFFTSSRYQYEFSYGFVIACLWCSMVCMSRVYLGMHSVLDVIAGLSIVGFLFHWVTSIADYLDPILLQHQYGGLFLLFGGILLSFTTPGGDRWTPARGDTVTIISTSVGLIFGAWINYQLGIIRGPALSPPYPVLWPSYDMLGLSLLRLIIGLVIVFATKTLVKSAAILTLGEEFRRASKALSYKSSQSKKEVFIELTYKFITYFVLGVNVVFLCPLVFRLIGIERPTFHTEV